MKDLKRAFGSPDPEFKDRVRQTLFRIEETEEPVPKNKLTFSMAMALILCVCITAASAWAGTELLSSKPDVTQPPLAHSENDSPSPNGTVVPGESIPILEVFWPEGTGNIFHFDANCVNMSWPCSVMLFSAALEAGGEACPLCFDEAAGFSTLPRLATENPEATPTPQPTTMPTYSPDVVYSSVTLTPMPTATSYAVSAVTPEPTPTYSPDVVYSSVTLTPMPTATSYAVSVVTPEPMRTYSPDVVYSSVTLTPMPTATSYAVTSAPTESTEASETDTPPSSESAVRTVYICKSEEDKFFHLGTACADIVSREIVNIFTLPLTEALDQGYSPCPHCCGNEETYIVHGSEYYHSPVGDCPYFLMSSSASVRVSLTEALLRGKLPCPECILPVSEVAEGTIIVCSFEPIVYLWDREAPVYHAIPRCSGFGYLYQMDISTAIEKDKTPCPECMNPEDTVWFTADSLYYHSYLHMAFTNLPDVTAASPMEALVKGKSPCANCILTSAAKADPSSVAGEIPPLWSTGSDECFFYEYSDGEDSGVFHLDPTCANLSNPTAISKETILSYALKPCALCAQSLLDAICLPEAETIYHFSDGCTHSAPSEFITLWEAQQRGLTPCPECASADIGCSVPLPTVPPQPTIPPNDNQDALREWMLSEEEMKECLFDLGAYNAETSVNAPAE